ncbi:MAG: hypothetical protein U0163_16815 [Gemmatimonadaceae bacterium]
MKRLSKMVAAVFALTVAWTTGCADSPVAVPTAVAVTHEQAPASDWLLTGVTQALPVGSVVNILGKLPQLTDVSVSAVIGVNGGVLSIPQSGITLTVPAGAVSAPVKFQITSLKGLSVAYEFEPHGMVFNKPLTIRQDLTKTLYLPGLPVGGAYFKSRDQLDLLGRKGTIDETIQSLLNPSVRVLEFPVRHFSGYLVSCG